MGHICQTLPSQECQDARIFTDKSGVSGCQDIHRQVTRLEDKIPQEVLGTDETDVGLVSRGCDRPARPSVDPGQEDWPDDITN